MDQRSKFSLKGILTEFVGEDQHDDEAIKCVLKGKVQLVYIKCKVPQHAPLSSVQRKFGSFGCGRSTLCEDMVSIKCLCSWFLYIQL